MVETRYGGIYEGGPWAAFDVRSPDALPDEAFGGDIVASEWWWGGPSVLVAVGDDPETARTLLLERIRQRNSGRRAHPLVAVGTSVRISSCAPDGWHRSEHGVVESAQRVDPPGRYSKPSIPAWQYQVRFADGSIEAIPEHYLRSSSAEGDRT